jgi:hypothetical protein
VETTLTVFLSAMLSNDTDICMVAGRDEPGPPLLVSHRRRTVQINPLRLQTHARTHAMVMSLSYAQTHDVTMTTTLSLSWGRGGGGGGDGDNSAPHVPHARGLHTPCHTAELPNSLCVRRVVVICVEVDNTRSTKT